MLRIFSYWGILKQVFPHGSVLGPLHFITDINNLPPTLSLKKQASYFLVADNFSSVANIVWSHTSEWFSANKFSLNLHDISTIKFTTNYAFIKTEDVEYMQESVNIKLLGLQYITT